MDTELIIDLDVRNMSVLSDSEIASLARLKVSDWVSKDSATIHGLKIATPWQRRGPGHKAFSLAVNQLKHTWPTVSTLMLGEDSDNETALAVYREYGMIDSGLIFKGNDGLDNRFEILFG